MVKEGGMALAAMCPCPAVPHFFSHQPLGAISKSPLKTLYSGSRLPFITKTFLNVCIHRTPVYGSVTTWSPENLLKTTNILGPFLDILSQ